MRAVLLLSVAFALCGCAIQPPKPWEKGNLARPDMQFDYDRLDVKTQQHIYTSKEAATGGYGVGGGGCGCN
jgi:starvation-inducible outer membrane lipoprotein